MDTKIVLNGNVQLMNDDGRNENYNPAVTDSNYPEGGIKWLIEYAHLAQGISLLTNNPAVKEVRYDIDLEVEGYSLWYKAFSVQRTTSQITFSIEFAVDDVDAYHTFELGAISNPAGYLTQPKFAIGMVTDCC